MNPVFECDIDEAECCEPESSLCHQGNITPFVVNATTPEHVKTAVQWAKENKIAVSVKATGHDQQGRSMNKYTLNIWLHNLKGIEFFDDWSPLDCESDN